MTDGSETGSGAPSPAWLARPWAARFARLGPWLLFAVAPFAVFPWGFIRSGMLEGYDDAYAFLPYLRHSAQALVRGEILWTPGIYLGAPLLGDPEFATLYVPRLVMLPFDPVTGFTVYLAGHYVLAQATAYLYLREIGVGRGAATLGGIAYAFGGFMLGQRTHTMYVTAGAWAPLVFFFLHRARVTGTGAAFLGAALAFAAVPLSGSLQLTLYLGVMILVYHAAHAYAERSPRALLLAAMALLPAVLVAAVQLLPTVDLLRDLALEERSAEGFALQGSWHPLLFSTLLVPTRHTPETAEFYARFGAVVFAGAAAALLGRDRRRPEVVGWATVAAVALTLMLGRHFPPLADVTARLPLIGKLRYPVRHAFELGIAVSMLGAIGVDALARMPAARLPGSVWAWLVGLPAVIAGSLFLTIRFAGGANLDPSLPPYLATLRMEQAIVPAIAAAIFATVYGFRLVRSPALAALPALALVVAETAYAVHVDLPGPYSNARAQIARADFRADPAAHARVLPPFPPIGFDSLPGSTALLFPGLQQLTGDAAIAPSDIVAVLDTDLQGYPADPPDLRWSRLPSVFGVTHLIGPEVICGDAAFALPRDEEAGEACARLPREAPGAPGATAAGAAGAGAKPAIVVRGVRRCTADISDGRRTFSLTGIARTVTPGGRGTLSVRVAGRLPGGPLVEEQREFVPKEVTYDPLPRQAALDLRPLPRAVEMTIGGSGNQQVVLSKLRLVSAAPKLIGEIRPDRPGDLASATVRDGAIVLAPSGDKTVAMASRLLRWPRARRTAAIEIEVVARALEPAPTRPLVVDLYGGPAFDPDEAQLVVKASRLTSRWATFHGDGIVVAGPERLRLRVFTFGSGRIAVRRVRIWVEQPNEGRPVVDATSELRVVGKARHTRQALVFGPGEGAATTVTYVPERPLQVRVAVAAPGGKAATPFVVAARPDGRDWVTRAVGPLALGARRRLAFTIAVSPDSGTLDLELRPRGGAGVHLGDLSVVDACRLRRYRRVRGMRAGLALYRNERALPRVYTARRLLRVDDIVEARAALRDSAAFVPGRDALITAPEDEGEAGGRAPPAGKPETVAPGVVTGARFGAQSVEVDVRAERGPTFLVVNDRYHRDWRATIDGSPVTLFRTNGLVRGVRVPRGSHTVRMFVTPSPWLGRGAAAAIAGVMLALWGLPRARRALER